MTGEAQSNPRPLIKRRWFLVTLIVIAVVAGGVGFWFRESFPYGHSHSCSKALAGGLLIYANDHEGWFPHGGRTPEESLSLACTNGDPYLLQGMLRGKHLPQSVVDGAFARDKVLSPESCGWHYVEGLRENDDPELAVGWDKTVGLGHNGNRMRGLEHEVWTVEGSTHLISKVAWPKLVERQRQLLAEAAANRSPASPAIRWSDEKSLGPNTAAPGNIKP